MKQANTNTSLRTYTCTSLLQMNKTNKHHNTQS